MTEGQHTDIGRFDRPRWRVAIVDDSPDVRMLLGALLERDGFEISAVAGSLGEALLVVPAAKVDLVLIDEHLGDDYGHRAIGMLQAMGVEAPMVIITGYASDLTVRRALGAGAVACLDKASAHRLPDVLRSIPDLQDSIPAVDAVAT